MTVGELRRIIADAPDGMKVVIHNDSSEWYGIEALEEAQVEQVYFKPAVTTGFVSDIHPDRFEKKPLYGSSPMDVLVIEFP
jgi:hypothetical protein